MDPSQLIAIDVGHTSTAIAPVVDGTLGDRIALDTQTLGDTMQAVQSALKALAGDQPRPVVLASVNEPVGEALCSALRDQLSDDVYVMGQDLPVPLATDLDPEATPGIDRLLGALAAWNTLGQACVVVDAGTCVTVDFVDGQGTWHGGAIAPGLRMQLQAMHKGTSTLPELEPAAPDAATDPYGASTSKGMQHGVFSSIRGLVREATERYAMAYDAWPPIVVTGGDAQVLFGEDELVDRIVPDLVLRGIACAARKVLMGSDTAS
jgi:type III pantothenate kinase